MAEEDTPILTVNSRLARYLLFKNSEHQKNIGKVAWETPQIIDLRTWFITKWNQSSPDQYILSNLQSIKIWESIIRSSEERQQVKNNKGIHKNRSLLNYRSAAKSAAEAYGLIKEYKLIINYHQLELVKETSLFFAWITEYKKFLKANNAVDPADLIDLVREKMINSHIPVPGKIELYGFDEINPQLETWLEFLRTQQIQVTLTPKQKNATNSSINKTSSNKDIKIHEFSDRNEEVINCARWVRSTYKDGLRIGIIVPELDIYRQKLNKELSSNLAPLSIFPWEDTELPFNISLGTPVASEPMVQVALDIISIPDNEISSLNLLQIIKSPYLNSGIKNKAVVNDLESRIQKEKLTILNLNQLNSFYNTKTAPDIEKLIGCLFVLTDLKEDQLPSAWAKIFSQLLKKLGWLDNSDKSISSREIQCLSMWNECLDDLASLDSFIGKLPRHKIVKGLQEITSDKLFQVKTKEQPIQVLGLLETAGMSFDHLWIMGCHSGCLPAQPNPNPFIPLNLQKKKLLPRSGYKRELQFAEKTLSRLLQSSQNLIISFPKWEKENNLQISPLLNGLSQPTTKFKNLNTYKIRDHIKPLEKVELWFDKPNIVPLPYEIKKFEKTGMRAGYKVIKYQADCPFKAFAAHRLEAEFFELPTIDFDSRERGVLIHRSLQLFWERHKTRDALEHLKNTNMLIKELKSSTMEAIKTYTNRLLKQPNFTKMEEERVVNLLAESMEEELNRPTFEVLHREKKETITIGKLKLHLRIDRIDITPEGHTILIDYKTGPIKPGAWFSKRIQDPQLPLYACKLSPRGIAFANIIKGDTKWISVYDKTSSIKGNTWKIPRNIPKETGWPEWKKLLNFWEDQLEILAKEFMDGRLAITPIKKEETCRNCGYQTLCRIGESSIINEDGKTLE